MNWLQGPFEPFERNLDAMLRSNDRLTRRLESVAAALAPPSRLFLSQKPHGSRWYQRVAIIMAGDGSLFAVNNRGRFYKGSRGYSSNGFRNNSCLESLTVAYRCLALVF